MLSGNSLVRETKCSVLQQVKGDFHCIVLQPLSWYLFHTLFISHIFKLFFLTKFISTSWNTQLKKAIKFRKGNSTALL